MANVIFDALDPSVIITSNDTIIGIWNTTAGRRSNLVSAGFIAGGYPIGEDPWKAFDGLNSTKYASYGICNSLYGSNSTMCGANTGVYTYSDRPASLLVAFRFQTTDSSSNHDPMYITIEGSNQDNSSLLLGSSWSMIYNGTSGLGAVPARRAYGVTIWLPKSVIWYTSYRILILSKRSVGETVEYSELELLGY
jgi:hypothetical protein